jgi:hypothetical protein
MPPHRRCNVGRLGAGAGVDLAVAVAVLGMVVAAAGCLPGDRPARAVLTAAAPFVDEFTDADLHDRYFVQGGSWRVVDGALSTLGDRNLPLWLDVALPRNVRVAFAVTSSSTAIDAKVELFGDGVRHQSGYVVILGGWNNTLSGIARLDEHERSRVMNRTGHEQGRTYDLVVQRTDGATVELFVDGAKVASYRDPQPLSGPGHDRFAFSGWESEVTFDHLTITALPE